MTRPARQIVAQRLFRGGGHLTTRNRLNALHGQKKGLPMPVPDFDLLRVHANLIFNRAKAVHDRLDTAAEAATDAERLAGLTEALHALETIGRHCQTFHPLLHDAVKAAHGRPRLVSRGQGDAD